MNIEFENEILVIVGMVIGLIFTLKIIFGFISRLIEVRASRKILGDLYTFVNGTFKNLIAYSNDKYDFDEKDDTL